MKLIICGPARHGKDTVAEMLSDKYGLRHESSSHWALRIFLRDVLESKYGLSYETEEECYEDRVNHRKIWYDEIKAYNLENPARLCKAIFEHSDIYVGMRDREEFLTSRPLTDLTIWVDARGRVPVKGEEAFADKLVRESDCDITITNDLGLKELEWKVYRLFEALALSI